MPLANTLSMLVFTIDSSIKLAFSNVRLDPSSVGINVGEYLCAVVCSLYAAGCWIYDFVEIRCFAKNH